MEVPTAAVSAVHRASALDYELTAYPGAAHREYLRGDMARYGGRLPPCNAREGGMNHAMA